MTGLHKLNIITTVFNTEYSLTVFNSPRELYSNFYPSQSIEMTMYMLR